MIFFSKWGWLLNCDGSGAALCMGGSRLNFGNDVPGIEDCSACRHGVRLVGKQVGLLSKG